MPALPRRPRTELRPALARPHAYSPAGGIFRDVTEAFGLLPTAQTLAAGNVAPPAGAGAGAGTALAAQVSSQAVVLFGTTPLELSRQASGALSGDDSGGAPAWRPPAGSSIGAAAVSEQAVLLFCTGPRRQLLALLPAAAEAAPAGGEALPALAAAAALPLSADLSCISNLLPQAAAPGEARRRAVLAVGTYASQVLLVQLAWDPWEPGAGASLAQLLSIDLTAAGLAGTLGAPAAPPAAASDMPLSPRAFQRLQLTPESLLLHPPAADGGGGSGSAGSSAASLLVGLRTGSLVQLRCAWGEQHAAVAAQEPLLSVPLGGMPVVLLPLPPLAPTPAAAAGMPAPSAVALSDRVCLLRHPASAAVGGGRVRCQQLALPGVQAAAPLLLDGGGLGGSSFMLDAAAPHEPAPAEQQQQMAEQGAADERQQAALQPPAAPQQQLYLLCAAADGCLSMVALDPLQLAATATLPLPQQLQPSRLALHAASGALVVGGSSAALAQAQRRRNQRRQPWMAGVGEEGEEEQAPAAAVQALEPTTGACRGGLVLACLWRRHR